MRTVKDKHRYLLQLLLLTAVYVSTAWVGFSFAFVERKISLVWPPTGIALAAILLFGYRLWPALVLGPIITGLLIKAPPGLTLAIAFSTAVGSLAGVYLLRWVGFHNQFNRVKDVLALIFPGAIITALISSTINILSFYMEGAAVRTKFGSTWLRWFMGDFLGILVVVPVILTWAIPTPRSKNPQKMLESGALTMLVVIASFSVYGGWLEKMTTYTASYIIFPIAVWAALRFGTRAVSAIVFYWTAAAVWGTVNGLGPFVQASLEESLAHLDFTIVIFISALLLAAEITERKQDQATLRESEERYRLLVEHSPEAIFVHTGNKMVFVNPAGLNLLGAAGPEQLIGKPPLDFLHPDYTGSVLENLEQLLVERKSVPISEEKFIRFDGVPIDVEVTSIPVTFQGKPAIQMVARDITTRKRAEEALRISEARFRELSEAAEEGLAIHQRGTILEANEALARMFGYQLHEMMGMSAAQLATPETWVIIMKHIEEDYDKPYEGIGIRKDGSTFWCQMVGKPYKHHGQLLHLSVFRDISDQKQAEEKLKISETRYRRLFEAAQDGILILDANTARIIDVNPYLEKMLEYPREEFIGRKLWEIGPFRDMEASKNAFAELQTKGYIRYEHLPLETSRGRHVDVEFVSNSYQDNQNKVIQCNIRDITARKQVEEKMLQAQIAIAKANQLKNDFLTNMSHEIRTPMNSILGFAQLLDEMIVEKQGQDKEIKIIDERRLEENVRENLQREYITAIKSCSEVLLNLLNDILDFKKIEAGKLELQYEFFTPLSIFSEMKQIFMPKIRDKKLELIVKIDPELPPTIFLDKLRLRQILFNLISNAIKFTYHGFIKLELQKAANGDNPEICNIIFTIQDTGIGISRDQMETIFEAFSQKKGQDMELFGGTGLGLSISRHLARMMNGVIHVESEEGKGSIFKVLFEGVKIGTGQEISEVQIKEDLDTTKFDNITILIADENKTRRLLKKQFFRSSLVHFIEAEDGRQTLEQARKYKPDIIIIHLRIPIMGGLEVARVLKEDAELCDIPIVAETSVPGNGEAILKTGFDGLLQGPYVRSRLIDELLRFLPRVIEKQLRRKTEIDNIKETYKLGNITPQAAAKLPGLITILKNELTIPWNHIRDTFILDEIDLFVKRVLNLGKIYDMAILTEWGNDIKNLAESCEMEKLMVTLDYFPRLVKQIENYLEEQDGKH